MGKALLDFGLQLAQGVAGAGMGMILGDRQNRQQMEMQREMADRQYQHNKDLMDKSYAHQFEMWKKTNYGAQMKELAAAGLNPGLLYGMGGQGGMTTGGGGASVGMGTANASQAPIEMAGMAMNLGLLRAQKENIEADTAKKQAETTKTAGVDTKEAETRILDLSQGIENKKAAELLTKAQTLIANLDGQLKGKTLNDMADLTAWQTGKALYEMEMAEREAYIQKATMQDKITLVKAEAIGAYLRNALTTAQTDKTRSDITVNKATIDKWAQEIAQGWMKLDQSEYDLLLKKFDTEMKAEFPSIWNVIGGTINGGIEELRDAIGDRGKRPTYKAPNR